MIYLQFLGMWCKIRETLGISSKLMGGKLRASCVSCFFALQPSSLPFDGHQKCLDPIQNPFVSWGKRHCQPSTPSYAIHNRATSCRTIGPIWNLPNWISIAKPNHRDQGLDPKHPNVCWLDPFFLVFFLGQQTNVLLGDKISSPNFRC